MKKIIGIVLIGLSILSCKQKEQESSAKKSVSKTEKTERNTALDTIKIDSSGLKNKIKLKEADSVSRIVDHYICYKDDKEPSRVIWISFTNESRAIEVKYKGQKNAISLEFEKEEYTQGGAHPTIVTYYNEFYEGRQNGKYKLTHSGLWDYVEYIRGKDKKVFNFTIDHDANPYGKKPCF